MQAKLLIATGNPGKLRELCTLLSGIPFEIVSPSEVGVLSDANEDGNTYEENAIIKARTMAFKTKLLTLADDSGLEVDALGGEPGIKSARFGGRGISDSERNALLLERLKDTPLTDRTAKFKCVIAIAEPGGRVETCSGECAGLIAAEPAGNKNFGYDPVFYFPQLGKTMAELSSDIKNRISHRGQAAAKARVLLESFR
ncbi:MAG: XTP/dITP diphosphatase [Dehalococcoidales bacterium]|nr:XTP/dITP diphosphatase [Dehalococcoidales bacterium]MDD4230780.1 XTP/dITP diphosphatase [Dehalococcoidales bacterium]MDD5402142.1 XTP/dITP diphosphatase [Dehalococcoidales bacterium]